MNQVEDYKGILTDIIKKQMVILGPSVALGTARKISNITVSEDGTVTDIKDPNQAMRDTTTAFMALSGQIFQNILNSILEKYPDINKAAAVA